MHRLEFPPVFIDDLGGCVEIGVNRVLGVIQKEGLPHGSPLDESDRLVAQPVGQKLMRRALRKRANLVEREEVVAVGNVLRLGADHLVEAKLFGAALGVFKMRVEVPFADVASDVACVGEQPIDRVLLLRVEVLR